jgi:hypothetical protein
VNLAYSLVEVKIFIGVVILAFPPTPLQQELRYRAFHICVVILAFPPTPLFSEN